MNLKRTLRFVAALNPLDGPLLGELGSKRLFYTWSKHRGKDISWRDDKLENNFFFFL